MGQAFGGMAVGRGALSKAAIKQPVEAAASAPSLGLCSLSYPVVGRLVVLVAQTVAADDATDAPHGFAGISERMTGTRSRC